MIHSLNSYRSVIAGEPSIRQIFSVNTEYKCKTRVETWHTLKCTLCRVYVLIF